MIIPGTRNTVGFLIDTASFCIEGGLGLLILYELGKIT